MNIYRLLIRALLLTFVTMVFSACAPAVVVVVTATPEPTAIVTDTPQPTATPTATPEATPTQEILQPTLDYNDFIRCGYAAANAGLNLRNFPAVDSDVIGRLPYGTRLIINLFASEDFPLWYNVEVPNDYNAPGWVSRAWTIITICDDAQNPMP